MSYRQRLALAVHSAAVTREERTSFPYGFERYAKVAASRMNTRLTKPAQGY